MKQYQLQFDLPNVNKGDIIKLSNRGVNYCCKDKNGHIASFSRKLIENNPTWFMEYNPPTEQPKEDAFIWTDELVIEVLNKTIEQIKNKLPVEPNSYPLGLRMWLNDFKASKQPSTPTDDYTVYKIWYTNNGAVDYKEEEIKNSYRLSKEKQSSNGSGTEDKKLLSLNDVKECYDSPHDSPLFQDLCAKLIRRAYKNVINK